MGVHHADFKLRSTTMYRIAFLFAGLAFVLTGCDDHVACMCNCNTNGAITTVHGEGCGRGCDEASDEALSEAAVPCIQGGGFLQGCSCGECESAGCSDLNRVTGLFVAADPTNGPADDSDAAPERAPAPAGGRRSILVRSGSRRD